MRFLHAAANIPFPLASLQVLLGIRTNMLVGGARLDPSNRRDYSEAEAREAFNRMVRDHGWF